ncbi:hypothetical protein P3342_005989 [Pyrenophora teres f. teres]|uniref:Rhodopsin domain-containing protein n=2 Tax=Pyrenophora teres f. teres TaxID=97479 RepID=E3S8S7_PYRTT|nr:hypothetical protein PTT_19412 [Pyrenophora teres f. teres 0-1]KAE8845606.1 hypothetical protein HRS9139_00173 [Pyrenophora teres f. teres]KAE8847744.1 hypothetical protein PTNB85_01587 [Pyrenophora teres f. teres]KAE8854101.1 hypothetical protein HRS9122_01093 [Pyrenophora teres f. teres]KAE8867671.1 hypothetical protein PTNB29_01582 [Pyrenophora teres f. teres]
MVPLSSNEGPRNAATTRSGFALVSTYTWACIVLLALVARFGQGYSHKVGFGRDDAAIVAGTIVYLGTTVCYQYAISGGLGKKEDDVTADDIAMFYQAMYAAALLGIVAMTLSKISSAFLIERVATQTRWPRMVLYGMIIAYAVFALFSVSFQCGLPKWTTDSLECRQAPIIIAAISFNMITDIALAFWLVPTLWKLSLDKEKVMSAGMLFGVRATVALASVGQIWAVVQVTTRHDPAHNAVDLVVFTQAVSGLSLIVASVPRIKRILGVSGSGILYPDIQQTEISLSHRSGNHASPPARNNSDPVLVPRDLGNFTVTISSKGCPKKKPREHPDWQAITMGTLPDEHTSTSSLFEHDDQEGVMMHHEVKVSVEGNRPRKMVFRQHQ